jgi:hypothetical protein
MLNRSITMAAVATAILTAGAAYPQELPQGGDPQRVEEQTRPVTWRLQLSPHTEHYGRSEDHRDVWLVGIERESPDGRLFGAGVFCNSFGQTSAYMYPWGGVHRNLFGVEPLFFKWAVGAIYGYRGEFRKRVPLNIGGFAPVVVPGFGYEIGRRTAVQLNFLGTAAVMFQFSVDLR